MDNDIHHIQANGRSTDLLAIVRRKDNISTQLDLVWHFTAETVLPIMPCTELHRIITYTLHVATGIATSSEELLYRLVS